MASVATLVGCNPPDKKDVTATAGVEASKGPATIEKSVNVPLAWKEEAFLLLHRLAEERLGADGAAERDRRLLGERDRQDEAVVVVGVLADQVHPTRGEGDHAGPGPVLDGGDRRKREAAAVRIAALKSDLAAAAGL